MSKVICVCRLTRREGSIIAGQRETRGGGFYKNDNENDEEMK